MQGAGFGPVEIWRSMGPMGEAVFSFLVLMSIYSISLMVDRVLYFRKSRKQSLLFIAKARPLITKRQFKNAQEESRSFSRGHVPRIYNAALQDYFSYTNNYFTEGDTPPSGFEETVRRAVERESDVVIQDLKHGLDALASIGATAPFVGLFGTVLGIMNAFFGMAKAGQGGIEAVAGGIAEALVNTAVGLFVALPAVWAFNYFSGRIEQFNVEMSNVGSELTDSFLKEHLSR